MREHDFVLDNIDDLEVLSRRVGVPRDIPPTANHRDRFRELPDLSGQALVLTDKEKHALHPRRAGGVQCVWTIVWEVDTADRDGRLGACLPLIAGVVNNYITVGI